MRSHRRMVGEGDSVKPVGAWSLSSVRGSAKADPLLVFRMYSRAGLVEPIGVDFLARIIYEGFYCNHRYAAMTSLTAGGFTA